MKLAVLQLITSPSLDDNLSAIEQQLQLLRQQAGEEPMLVVLPECCLLFGGHDGQWRQQAEPQGEGPMQSAMAALAKAYDCYLLAGTLPLQTNDGRAAASSLLYAPDGELVGRYDKIHLFDVTVADGTGSYRESDNTYPGQQLTLVDTPLGRIGFAVCYDLRFSALFRALRAQGADIIVLPAAFTKHTGEAHWEILLRARAIESQCYLVAANQGGTHANGRETWGHSMVVDPWGSVVAEVDQGVGAAMATLEPALLTEVRGKMPMANQERFSSAELVKSPTST